MNTNDHLPNKSDKLSPIFWGSFFVSLGVGILLKKYGIITFQDVYFTNIVSVLLVLIGIAFLNVPRFVKQILVGLVAVSISIFFLSLFGSIHREIKCFINDNDNYSSTNNAANTIEYDAVADSANIVIQAGAIELDVSSISTKALKYSADDIRGFKLNHDSTFKNYELICNPKNWKSFKNGFSGDLQLNDSTIWSINAKLGATEFNGNFKEIKVGKLYLSAGASDINLDFGNKHTDTEMLIESGASDIEINIPFDSYCEISTNIALTSANFENFEEVNPGFYRAGNPDSHSNKFTITISGGVSNFQINRIK